MKKMSIIITLVLICSMAVVVYATDGGNCHLHYETTTTGDTCACDQSGGVSVGTCNEPLVYTYTWSCEGGDDCCGGTSCGASGTVNKLATKTYPCAGEAGGMTCNLDERHGVRINCVGGTATTTNANVSDCACI